MRQTTLTRRRTPFWLGCGCGAIVVTALVVISVSLLLILQPGFLTSLGLQAFGFQPTGETVEEVFANAAPIPNIELQNATQPQQVYVQAGDLGAVNLDTSAYQVAVGQDASTGSTLVTAAVSEGELLSLCQQRSTLCSTGDERIRGVSFDLRPGGGIINGEVNVPQVGWQRAGVVVELDSQAAQFTVAGVEVGGMIFQTPPGELATFVDEVARRGNELLREITLDAMGSQYTLDEVYADDNQLLMILR